MNDTIRWGIISTANIGTENVIPAIQWASNCSVEAISSRDQAVAQSAADRLNIPRAFGSYEAMLADPDIDAVYNPLPNHLHQEWTLKALEAGKHVLCEKPIGMNVAEARTIDAAANEHGLKVMEAFMYKLHPSWVKVQELIAEGRIGQVKAVQSWFSYFNDDPTNIRNIAEYGGGALMDIGCYAISASRLAFGDEPDRIEATMRRHPQWGTDFTTTALMEFPGGGVADFTVSTQMESDQRVSIVGTTGRIEVQIPFNIPADIPTRIFVTNGGDAPVNPNTETIEFAAKNQYTSQAEGFAAAILNDTQVPTPLSDAIANMDVIDRIVVAADRA